MILSCLLPAYQNKIFEYSPNLIKKATAGFGHADKSGVQAMLARSLGVSEFKTHDESDATYIALAIF